MAGPQQELVFAPLGGVGEIGMNLSIYGLRTGNRRQWLAVDLGVSFAAEEHLPGVDLILPDIRYLVEERKNLAPTRFAIFVVHNKEKAGGKRGTLPILPKDLPKGEDKVVDGLSEGVRYYSTQDIGDVWICYPWEEEYVVDFGPLLFDAMVLRQDTTDTDSLYLHSPRFNSAGTSSSTTVLQLSPRSSVSISPTKQPVSQTLAPALLDWTCNRSKQAASLCLCISSSIAMEHCIF